jgi:hypothetical protein
MVVSVGMVVTSGQLRAARNCVYLKTALDEIKAALTASDLSANFSWFHVPEGAYDRGYAILYQLVSDDEAKLAIGGGRDARTIFGDKFSKSREIEGFGRQEFLYDFLIFCVGHNILFLHGCIN